MLKYKDRKVILVEKKGGCNSCVVDDELETCHLCEECGIGSRVFEYLVEDDAHLIIANIRQQLVRLEKVI